ncbi:hypothetical protein HA49_04210 [Tatumella morbirosei]|uniref:LarC family nickel insertion protein n=1 Tax=Tatumella morbirosei TaxID=642227 RepID=A0A095TJ06_9GAMM|nr:LarC family nickel insertion protein [Tatumella morbirosei]KGD76702.1 hypothetical protein HA49_04210 [Tatumella morbirosei]
MHVHMDFIGGMAGDMFCAAMLDAFPELTEPLQQQLSGLAFFESYQITTRPATQKDICGKRFLVMKKNAVFDDKNHIIFTPQTTSSSSLSRHATATDHHHYSFADIDRRIQQVSDPQIRQGVSEIYRRLIQAESEVHGIPVDQIHLHEVGADDALIDIISAVFLVLRSGARSWSFSPLPWGNGTVHCAHGDLPVPAPATVKLLKTFRWSHDDETGERVTPTGAAILSWLAEHQSVRPVGGLYRDGYGCGKRQFTRLANILRICVFTTDQPAPQDELQDQVMIVQFDIDDMSGEALAIAQQKLREIPEVIELSASCLTGKKQRMLFRTELLCVPEKLQHICQQILLLTTTLGVRYWLSSRFKLPRQASEVEYQHQQWPVKIATRPDGSFTAKLEADAWQQVLHNYAASAELKYHVEMLAVNRKSNRGTD